MGLESKLMKDIAELVEQQQTWHTSLQQNVAEHRLVLNAHTDSIEKMSEQAAEHRPADAVDAELNEKVNNLSIAQKDLKSLVSSVVEKDLDFRDYIQSTLSAFETKLHAKIADARSRSENQDSHSSEHLEVSNPMTWNRR